MTRNKNIENASDDAYDDDVPYDVDAGADANDSGDSSSEQDEKKERAFSTILSDYDFYLTGEGKHWKIYDKLGAHLRMIDGVEGVNFIVWAPNAEKVSVVGDFNDWDGQKNPMFKHNPSGLWETFVPGVREGDLYKYRVEANGQISERPDPYGFYAEVAPKTASIVANLDAYVWNDEIWLRDRENEGAASLHRPVSIYEVCLASWIRQEKKSERTPGYREIVDSLIEYIKKMRYTHIELTSTAEQPTTMTWRNPIVGMFSLTSRYGSPEDFMYFVDKCHQNGIGVVVDCTPARFPKDGRGLRRFDGTALYEREGRQNDETQDWGNLSFNYAKNEVQNYLIANALFWLDKYHIDGLFVDSVDSMIYPDHNCEEGDWEPGQNGGRENLEAIEFLKEMNVQAHGQYSGVLTIAEESTDRYGVCKSVSEGGLGFSMKWNQSWTNDALKCCREDPLYRKYQHDQLVGNFKRAFSENFVLPISHNDVECGKGTVVGNAPGDLWQKFALARLLYSYMWAHPGKKLLFMGCDIGQLKEWDFDEALDWDLLWYDETHGGLQRCVADLNELYRDEKALYELDFDRRGFEWINSQDWEECLFSFVRKGLNPGEHLVVVANFTPAPRRKSIGVPAPVDYEEIFCSDDFDYGGSGVKNGRVKSQRVPCDGRQYSIEVLFPPLGVSFFKPVWNAK